MQYILASVDFSQTSANALLYTLEMAALLQRKVLCIHIYHGSFTTEQMPVFSPQKGHHEVILQRLREFIDQAQKDSGLSREAQTVEVEIDALHGLVEQQLIKLSNQPEIDLLFMGASGKHGLSGRLFGSMTETVARQAHCPVVLIPNEYRFHPIQNLLFASDNSEADEPVVNWIVQLANSFKASLSIVHFTGEEERSQADLQEMYDRWKTFLQDKLHKKASLSIHQLPAEGRISEAIRQFGLDHQIDLIGMVARKRSFWESLFQSSQTKRIALKLQIPLMVFHEEKP